MVIKTKHSVVRTATALLLALLLTASVSMTAFAASGDPLRALAEKAGCDYEDILTSSLVVAGESVSDWIAIATGCSGNPVKREAYLQGLEAYVTGEYEKNGCLHSIKATEYHRISLAVLALGGDPTCFGTDPSGDPVDLIAEGTYNWSNSDSLGLQGLNGWIWALITLDAKYYQVPADALYTREDMIAAILAAQTDEGGFGLAGGSPDVDITAMALQALAPYYSQDTNIKGSVDRALGWLSAQQNNSGDFTSWGAGTAEGTAQTVIALCSLGIDPRTDDWFVKDGNSAIDGLLAYQTENGMFRHILEEDADVMATEQAALALIALERLEANGNRLYDFTEIAVYEEETGTAVADTAAAGDGVADTAADTSGKPADPSVKMEWVIGCIVIAVVATGVIFVFVKRGKKKHV